MRGASFWNDILSKTMTVYANLIFIVLWFGFVIALVLNREWLDEIWSWVQALPSVPKVLVWVFFLPITVGLWIYESSWSTIGRLVGFTGIVAWTLLALYSLFKFFR